MNKSINQLAVKVVKEIMAREGELGVEVIKMKCGATLIDMGLHAKGSNAAGILFTRVTLGDMAQVSLGSWKLDDDHSFGCVEVFVSEPLVACLASQIAGWQLGRGEFATIGSGPARAQAVIPGDAYLNMTPYRDRNDEVVLCLQDIRYPDDSIALEVARACQVLPENVYLLIAPSASIVGGIQVSARMVEEVCHKMHAKDFAVSKVVNARGRAPIAPLVADEVKAIGRINDAILYGGEAEFWVDAADEEIAAVIEKLVSKTSSPYYPELFAAVFEKAGRDFYRIDHDFHSIARLQIHNIRTGHGFAAGEINYAVIRQSFLS
ncbi:MAG TPA: methenyltetrahydromethanopterin cyclohydrolase [Anaerolineales bacterium]|nr:methenyltetrahydromethanopterin cyclohydrolase [Anaerolineales bacterium]